MDNIILPLLQICDSSLPTGSFSHSFGLETYIQENVIYNKKSFIEWLEVYIENQLVYSDGLSCRIAYETLENNELKTLWTLDQMLIAQINALETRKGVQKIGKRLLALGNRLYPSTILNQYQELVNQNICQSHPALVFAIIGYHLNIPKSTTVLSYLFSTIISLVQNAVRAIPLGQTEGQDIIKDSQQLIIKSWKVIQDLTFDDFGITSPGIEIAQMKHERVHIRIFMS